MTTYTVDTKNIDLLGKTVSNKYRKLIPKARQATLNRVAFGAQKEIKAEMPKSLDRPRANTVRSVTAFRARTPSDDFSAVYLQEWSSRFLQPNIDGETLTALNGRSPVLVPVITALKNSNVRKILGIPKLVDKHGNLKGLKNGLIQKIIDSPHTFSIRTARDHLKAGIHVRFRDGLITVFLYKDQLEKEPVLDFGGIAQDFHNENFRKLWVKSFREAAGKISR